jgi:hypothetical protein
MAQGTIHLFLVVMALVRACLKIMLLMFLHCLFTLWWFSSFDRTWQMISSHTAACRLVVEALELLPPPPESLPKQEVASLATAVVAGGAKHAKLVCLSFSDERLCIGSLSLFGHGLPVHELLELLGLRQIECTPWGTTLRVLPAEALRFLRLNSSRHIRAMAELTQRSSLRKWMRNLSQ